MTDRVKGMFEKRDSHSILPGDTLRARFSAYAQRLTAFTQKAVQTQSYSDREENLARLIADEMRALGFDEAFIDATGNAAGRVGNGKKVIHFDGHMDTVEVNDEDMWALPPFSGTILDEMLWGRGSVDMKGGLCASIVAAALAKEMGYLEGKTVYVTGTVCEEYCDGVSLRHFYQERNLRPDYCIICEPSDNVITLGHKGKGQARVHTRGVSAHGSAPEKGRNAVYEMAQIIGRVDALNRSLSSSAEGIHGTAVLSDISCESASLNAVPGACSIYVDRRLSPAQSIDDFRREMDALILGKDAWWEVGTLRRRSWTGKDLVYEPMHDPWRIGRDDHLTVSMEKAYARVMGKGADTNGFWDFGTNAVTPVAMGIPTIGFGPGDYKLAHMRDERCPVSQIHEACLVYAALIDVI